VDLCNRIKIVGPADPRRIGDGATRYTFDIARLKAAAKRFEPLANP
jgi:hypothetical protein